MLNPTPPEHLLDAQGRPYFLWDCDVTMERLRELLASDDLDTRAYWMGKVMRQARPDDALTLIDRADMRTCWDAARPHLGRTLPFWRWLLLEYPARG